MAEYSPIAKIRIKNFRSIGDVTIGFEDSPIVTLMGENEAGKTSIIKAIAVAGANAYPARQARFVRTGTNGFGIQVDFADGSCLVRQKGGPGVGNSLSIILPDGSVLRDEKIDRGEGIPVNMQKLMGFVVEPETSELLNVRTYEDALMFVVTSDSTNYKVLYNALKVGQITRAVKAGNQKANGLRAEVNNNEVKMSGITEALKGIRLVDVEPAKNIRERLQGQLQVLGELEKAVSSQRAVEAGQLSLGALAVIEREGLLEVDLRTVEALERAVKTCSGQRQAERRLAGVEQIQSVEEINLRTIEVLKAGIALRSEGKALKSKAEAYGNVSRLAEISTEAVGRLQEAIGSWGELKEQENKQRVYGQIENLEGVNLELLDKIGQLVEISRILANEEQELEKANKALGEVIIDIRSAGGSVGDCSRCGQPVVVVNGESRDFCER